MTLSDLTHAMERAYTAIRTIHPDAQPALIVVYRHPAGDRRGHYAPQSWRTKAQDGDTALDEIHISSTILDQGPKSVMQTLLHEAAHSIAGTRRIQDTSRQGRYHNREFSKLAQELGLVTNDDPSIGCITTDLTPQAQKQFRNVIKELGEALTIWQDSAAAAGKGKAKGKQSQVKFMCSCNRIIRMSRQVYQQGPIVCSLCGSPFEPNDTADDDTADDN